MVVSIYTLPEEGKLWTECKTGDITDCISYEYEKFFNGVGTFTMELPINTRFGGRIGKNTVLVTDGGDELIVKNIKTTADKITLTGYDLNGILLDRLTVPKGGASDGFDLCEGSTEACVKHYVEDNFVSSVVAERNLPRFGVAENTLDRGAADDHAMPRLEVVADIVTEMCGAAGLGWRVSINRSAGLLGDIFVFDVAEQVDRTVNQSERNRVIFSIQQHNVSEMTREVGITAAKNVLYCDIGGTVVQYPQAGSTEGRTAGVGYSRREEYCALSGDSLDPEKYGVEAEQNMSDRMEETDSLVIDAGSPLDYGVLYDVGTIATAYDRKRSLQLDSVISSVAVKRSGTEYSVKLSLGNSKPKLLDGYEKKNDAARKNVRDNAGKDKAVYVSLPVTNPAAVNYDAIERGLLSVDFTVSGTDSAVVFAGAQQCSAASAGTVDIAYKVDGATQDHKPSQALTAGRHILPHYLAMALSKGKHNFAVYITSADGRGSTPINGFAAALSGQISGIKINTPPNDNLLLYFGGVPAGTTITLPQLYSGSGADKTVDWGDGSAAETSACNAAVEHTYADGGDFVVTIKSTETSFMDSSLGAPLGDYLTAVYLPDNAALISWSRILSDCPNLETVYLGKSAAHISLGLKNDGKITSLIFPDTATYISIAGFATTAVSAVVIPEKVTSVSGFSSNSNLRSIEFYNETLAGNQGCNGDKNLTGVYMTDKVTRIPYQSFLNCAALSSVTFSQNLITIDAFGFGGTALAELPLLPKLTTIGNCAFQNCKSLCSVKLGDRVTTIGSSAFNNCTSLTDIRLPSSLQTIGDTAFSTVPAPFTIADFPAKLTSVGKTAFQGSGVVSAILRRGATYGSSCFMQCTDLSEVVVEDGVSIIPEAIFRECPALLEIVLPSSVITINNQAFYKSGLAEITLAEGLTTIGNDAFAYSQLMSVVLPETLTALGSNAFQACKNLESVAIKSGGLKTISSTAFAQCTALKAVSLGSVTQIGSGAFSGCTSLEGISFNTDTVLGSSAFSGAGLKAVSILGKIKQFDDGRTSESSGRYNIGGSCFYNCAALAEVDGYEYKFDVGLKKTEYFRASTSENWGEAVVTDLGLRSDARGIYNAMGATTDSIFSRTALKSASNYLKEHPEYSNESTSDYKRTYTAYDIKPTV